MPRNPWRRRRSADNPRPAGRRWSRGLRRSGSFARRVLVGRRRAERLATLAPPPGSEEGPEGLAARPAMAVRPISPAPVGSSPTAAGSGAAADSSGGPVAVPLLPGEHTLARRLAFGVVNACSIASILLGLTAVFLALGGEVRPAALVLLGCVAFDGVDGALARRFGVASPFGAQMDSLADMSSFGLATPLVAYFWLAGQAPAALVGALCIGTAVCAAVRLARFNVSPKDGRYFCGVPTTMAAAIVAATIVVNPVPQSVVMALVIVGGLAALMVTSFPYAKLARIAKLPPWLWVLPVVGALVDASSTFAALVVAYLLSGPLLWLWQRGRQRRTTRRRLAA